MSDWGAGRAHRAGRQRRAGPRHARARTGRGATRSSTAVRDGRVSEAAVDDKVLRLLRLAERVGALAAIAPHRRGATRRSRPSCARPPPRASCSRATTGRCCRSGPLRTRRRARPERRRRAHARRRQRDRVPVLHRVAAGRAARGAGRRGHVRARRARVHAAAGGRGERRGALPRRRRQRAVARAARDRRVHVARDARRRRRRDRADRDGARRAGRRVRDRLLRRRPPPALARRRAGVRRACSSCSPGADLGEALFAPPQHGVPVTLAAGQEVAVVLRRELADRDFDLVTLQLNVEPPFGDGRARAGGRAGARGRRRGGRRRHDARRSRARASTARRWRCPGRQDELVRRVAIANPRTVVVVNAGAPVLMPWLDEVPAVLLDLVPGAGGGQRDRRRAPRAARSPAAGCRRRGRRRRRAIRR